MRDDSLVDTDRPHTRFSDAGNDVVARMLWRPASEKRQGTKSRSEVHRWCGGLYGELTAAHELEAV